MRIAVRKWCNSLALRIPKVYAGETQIQEGSSVDLSLQDGTLVITPVDKKAFTLEQILKDVRPEIRHPSMDSGSAVGQEIW